MILGKSLNHSELQSLQNEEKNACLSNLIESLWIKWCTQNLPIKCYINVRVYVDTKILTAQQGRFKACRNTYNTRQKVNAILIEVQIYLFIRSKYLLSSNMGQMTCSNGVQRSSEEEELPACPLNAPCQDYSPDLTVSLMLSVWLSFLPTTVKLMIWFDFLSLQGLPLVWRWFPPSVSLPLLYLSLTWRWKGERMDQLWKHTCLDSALSKLHDLGTFPDIFESGDPLYTVGEIILTW